MSVSGRHVMWLWYVCENQKVHKWRWEPLRQHKKCWLYARVFACVWPLPSGVCPRLLRGAGRRGRGRTGGRPRWPAPGGGERAAAAHLGDRLTAPRGRLRRGRPDRPIRGLLWCCYENVMWRGFFCREGEGVGAARVGWVGGLLLTLVVALGSPRLWVCLPRVCLFSHLSIPFITRPVGSPKTTPVSPAPVKLMLCMYMCQPL